MRGTVTKVQKKCQGREIPFCVPTGILQSMERRWDSWRKKLHPQFIELASLYREGVKRFLAWEAEPPPDKVRELRQWFEQELSELGRRVGGGSYMPSGPDPRGIIFVNPDSASLDQRFIEHLHFQRFREPLWIATQKQQAGDLEAHRRIFRTGEDYIRAQFGKGGIKPTKGDYDHSGLFLIGFSMGLNDLTAEELADCFEELCPCGKLHDADALKKQRSRFVNECQEAADWLASERAKIPARELMYAFGKDLLWAKASLVSLGEPPVVFAGLLGQPAACCIDDQGQIFFYEDLAIDKASFEQSLPDKLCVATVLDIFKMFFSGTENT